MSAPLFTPGPWTVSESGILCDREYNYGVVAIARDGHVYSEYTSDGPTLDFHNEADANLIAAAPELYVVLEAALAHIGRDHVLSGRIGAALARARGQS